ncbi:peptidoglycan-binding domain-containing protein [Streptomyces sp. NPDC056264]|uniref:peptidoglycan-binding domain-containing protein n=1 Tax=Streptomyces sp. NPDC056264 TaxID=3345767 RepID=UPI003AB04BC5
MRNRTALTTAVTPVREAARPEHPSDRVFGKVARLDHSGAGVRGQDIELFDAVVRPPKATAPASALASSAPSSGAHRSRRPRPAPHARRSLSLPLMVAGAFSAGLAGALTVWLSADSEPAPQSPPSRSVAVPDLVAATAPTGNPTADDSLPPAVARPSTAAGDARGRTARSTPSPAPTSPAPPSASPSPTPTPTRSLVPATTPPPPPPSPHRPHRTGRPAPREISVGSTGPDVADLQRRLQQLYLYLGSADGVFTAYVGEALSRFQIARNIPETPGVYGPLTRAALQAETD